MHVEPFQPESARPVGSCRPCEGEGGPCLDRRGFLGRTAAALAALGLPSALRPRAAVASPRPGAETEPIVRDAFYAELRAHLHYLGYARIADLEGYANIGYLFSTFARSELVHALQFQSLLETLGPGLGKPDALTLEIAHTKANLNEAAKKELLKIDRLYPAFLEALRPEGNAEAIRYCNYAWESHKQHRDQIESIARWAGTFFGTVAGKIEAKDLRYFVCGECGSTVADPPDAECAICGQGPHRYAEVARPK